MPVHQSGSLLGRLLTLAQSDTTFTTAGCVTWSTMLDDTSCPPLWCVLLYDGERHCQALMCDVH